MEIMYQYFLSIVDKSANGLKLKVFVAADESDAAAA